MVARDGGGIQVNVIGRVTADLKAILLAEGNAV